MNTRLSGFRFVSLCIISVALIGYELAVMRCFSVGSWANFGSMVISIALLGFGLAGTILTFAEAKIERRPDDWLAWTATLLGPTMAIAHAAAQAVPFNPVMITTDRLQYLWIGSYYVLYCLPFFVGALYIGVAFIAFRSRIHSLYFWNMFGSGLGGFALLFALYALPPGRLVGALAALASLAAIFSLVRYRDATGRLEVSPKGCLIVVGSLGASLLVLALFGEVRVSEFKPISYARSFPDSKLVYHSFGPTGVYDVYSSSFFHVAPGLSDNASSELASLPRDAFLGLYVDGDGPMGVMRRLEGPESSYFDYLPTAAPYALLDQPDVLVLKLGGGIGVYGALHHGAKSVTVVESDPELVRMLRDESVFRSFTGDLLRDGRVRLERTEPRAFVAGARGRFDLVEIGLVDSVGLSQTGGNPVDENFLYTAEGIAAYLSALRPGGILSITVWNRLTPPRNVPKLLATVADALRMTGAADPKGSVFVFDQLLSTATVLVKNGAFQGSELHALRDFCSRMSFVPCYYAGMPRPTLDARRVLDWYARQMAVPAAAGAGSDGARKPDADASAGDAAPEGAGDLFQEDLYYYVLDSMFSGDARTFLASYPFSIGPATDDRPYYTAYVKPSELPAVASHMRELAEEWGYLLLVGTLGLSLVFGLVIILVPMIGRRKELFARRKGTLRVIAYFAALGLGYMMMEMFLIQRLTFFLVDPIFSTSVVMTALMVASGIGSVASASWRLPPGRRVLIAAAGIALCCLFYVLGLTPLVDRLLGLALAPKILIAVAVIAPAAFCLGIPFPTGLSSLSASRPGLVPWAWGVNGALSVTGTVLARLVSISAGYSVVLLVAACLYACAAATFSGNR